MVHGGFFISIELNCQNSKSEESRFKYLRMQFDVMTESALSEFTETCYRKTRMPWRLTLTKMRWSELRAMNSPERNYSQNMLPHPSQRGG